MKKCVEELDDLLKESPQQIPRKTLEKIRGFMNYVTQTYKSMIPYLNGLHLTIDGWRPNRDKEGWRVKEEPEVDVPYPTQPKYVAAKPRLHHDVAALKALCASERPPWRRVRPSKTATVFYGFGDASGTAYGSAFQKAPTKGKPTDVFFECGQWTPAVGENESSNWRELTNLVEFLEGQGHAGCLDDSEVFMFTDNSTAEAAFWKGTSKSRKLLGLVLRLRLLEMRTGMILHLIHVSGTRMIQVGADGLSRGDHSTGVMAGKDMLSYIPLNESVPQRSPQVKSWLDSILQDAQPAFLTPNDWYNPLRANNTWIWTPPPAAADAAVERLRTARHLRPNSLHIIILPRLMTGRWRKNLGKASDCYMKLALEEIWPLATQFEPLLMFVCLPYLPHAPRFVERQSICRRLHRSLREGDVQEVDYALQRAVLRKLFSEAWALSSL